MEQTLPLRLDLRIDWSEQDLFGHVNNVMYSKYIQAARVNLWEKIGLTKHYSETNIGPTLAAISIQFKSPLFYPGNIYLLSGIKEIRTTSFIIAHELYTAQDTLSAIAEDVIVMFDYNSHQKVSMSEHIRGAYSAILQTKS